MRIILLFYLAFLSGGFACGQQAQEARLTPEALVRQLTGFPAVSPLQADTATSMPDTRPPIDEKNTPYLFPHEHPDLPAHIAAWLNERGYVIPQDIPQEYWDEYFPINAITGEFITKGQTDWAVYCTNRKTTAIIIFKDGKVESPEIMDTYPESISRSHPEGIPFDCCYGWITTISPEKIYTTYLRMRNYSVSQPPPLYHDGIMTGACMHFRTAIYFKFEDKWCSMHSSE